MYICDLSLDDFRSYHKALISLEPGVTAFIGSNGQGKTNLVEAVGYLATLSSHRVGADAALVRRAAPGEPQPAGAVLRAKVMHGQRPSVLELEIIAGKANRARLNRNTVRPRDLLGVLRTVTFAPEDLSLVRGEPGVRRKFLDDLAVTLRPALAGVRAEHDKILAQRSSLLKSARAAKGSARTSALSTLEVWDAQLAAAAATLIAARVDVLSRLRPWVAHTYEYVSEAQSPVYLAYRSSLLLHEGVSEPEAGGELFARGERADAAASAASDTHPGLVPQWLSHEMDLADPAQVAVRLEEAMRELHSREIERGANLVGAHRDDVSLFIGSLPAKGFASHGEQWSMALALRLASYEMLRHDHDAYGNDGEPVLILDDVFASLDDKRRKALSTMVAGAGQVLLTAAVDADVPAELAGARFRVANSEITRE